MIGVYKIENNINKKVYIGSSFCIEKRWKKHRVSLNSGKHYNNHLQDAYNLYGKDTFLYSVLEECEKTCLEECEQKWIEFYGGNNSVNTYNFRGAGNHGEVGLETREKLKVNSHFVNFPNEKRLENNARRKQRGGYVMSEEQKEKISIALTGRKLPKEVIDKIYNSRKGYRHSEETKQKISVGNKGKVMSDEAKLKISEAKKGMFMGEDNPFYGKHHTKETRELLSEYNKLGIIGRKGRKNSKEHNEAVRRANVGRKPTEEQLKHASESHKGQIPWNKGLKGVKRLKDGE